MTEPQNRAAAPAPEHHVDPGPTNEVIAKLAALLWEQEGRPAGRDVEFWLRAEAELKPATKPARDEDARPT